MLFVRELFIVIVFFFASVEAHTRIASPFKPIRKAKEEIMEKERIP